MLYVDVPIIGGGPAGSSLGYILQKAGLTCCIVDKARFPRKKLCGGLLTKKTWEIIDDIFGDTSFPCERVSQNVSLFLGDQKLSNIQADSEFYLVDRVDFDFWFIEKYLAVNGYLFEDAVLKETHLDANSVVLSSGEEIGYKVLVGADGANSQVRKYIDGKYRLNAICLEFDSPSSDISDEIQVYFSAINAGYGWCFPKKNHYTIGVGGIIEANQNIKKSFKTFYRSIGKTVGNEKTVGAFIPFGKYVKTPYRNNILLIGDAAGLVDPITGEGIYFAFLSASYASEVIIGFLRSENDLSAYLKKIRGIHNIISNGNHFNRLFLNGLTKPFFLKFVNGKTHVTRYFCENLLSHYNMTYLGFVVKYMKARHERKKAER
jgi:geranylgeranyl reductase family protein